MAKLSLLIFAFILCLGTGSATGAESQLAFVRGGSIWLVQSDGSRARQLTRGPQDRQPALSPDGGLVAFTSSRDADHGFGQIFLLSSSGGQPRPFLPPGLQGGEHPAFAPDGKRLLFVGLADLQKKKSQGSDLCYATMSVSIADLQGKAVRQIIRNPQTMLDTGYIYSNPVFSRDGKRLAYQESGSDVSGGFVVINLKGEKILRFPRNSEDYTPYWGPRFSPDGKKILCYSPATSPERVDTVYLVDLATGAKTRITAGSKPTFVDQGRAIVFERWSQSRWTDSGKATADLWRLELTLGAAAKKIITDGQEPAGP